MSPKGSDSKNGELDFVNVALVVDGVGETSYLATQDHSKEKSTDKLEPLPEPSNLEGISEEDESVKERKMRKGKATHQ
ncbi:hypothetical protein KI387_036001, partial [Taxus chinensis]